MYVFIYIYYHHIHIQLPQPQTTTIHSASCLSACEVCVPVGGRKETTSASCNRWHHHRCKECLHQWLKEKHYQCKLQTVTTTMCASGVLALVDRKITSQAQGAKARTQGAKVITEGAKVRTMQHQRKSVSDAVTIFNYNHHHHWSGPTQHDAAITCIMAHE